MMATNSLQIADHLCDVFRFLLPTAETKAAAMPRLSPRVYVNIVTIVQFAQNGRVRFVKLRSSDLHVHMSRVAACAGCNGSRSKHSIFAHGRCKLQWQQQQSVIYLFIADTSRPIGSQPFKW